MPWLRPEALAMVARSPSPETPSPSSSQSATMLPLPATSTVPSESTKMPRGFARPVANVNAQNPSGTFASSSALAGNEQVDTPPGRAPPSDGPPAPGEAPPLDGLPPVEGLPPVDGAPARPPVDVSSVFSSSSHAEIETHTAHAKSHRGIMP